jgi:LysW-gamma-L-alpha-aminoadipyl-6-phosphate/LysW-L-glutamyl-5-phosphate reductase
MINVSIVGGSGYGGGEILRILLNHPLVKVKQVTSRKYNKLPITSVHPNLRKMTNLTFCLPEEITETDLLFLCLPNGESQKLLTKVRDKAKKIIDLGADYRIKNIKEYLKYYGKHENTEYLGQFVYGLSELHRDEIKNSNYVACGGCEATCSILSLYPLLKEGIVDRTKPLIIEGKIGSSAAGAKPGISTHHPERSGCVRSYKATGHRHIAEIKQEVGFEQDLEVYLSATAIEMVRGILTTAHVFLEDDLSETDILKIYNKYYRHEPFVRIIKTKMGIYRFPEPKIVAGTNFCDIGFEKEKDSRRLVVIGAIDNLVKGTAGQAVQAMNILFGFEETTGLEFTGLHPV